MKDFRKEETMSPSCWTTCKSYTLRAFPRVLTLGEKDMAGCAGWIPEFLFSAESPKDSHCPLKKRTLSCSHPVQRPWRGAWNLVNSLLDAPVFPQAPRLSTVWTGPPSHPR